MAKYVQHFSTRIPWKDNGFEGRIDNNPKYNIAAHIIPNIATSRDLDFEEKNKGKAYSEVGSINMQSWITENAAFMCDHSLTLKMNHPYKSSKKNVRFQHYQETLFEVESYSFLLRPFSWTIIENALEKSKYHNFYFDNEKTKGMLEWKSTWVSHGESQKGIFDYFFSGIEPGESLIFPYYKQVPFIDDGRRVIAGIGNLLNSVTLHEYQNDNSRSENNYIWETNANHSIRTDGSTGFLMPYNEIAEYSRTHPDFDVTGVTIFGAEGFKNEFSYAAEWVCYDASIDVLNQAKNVIANLRGLNLETASGEWINRQLSYLNTQIEKVWNQRGVFPGLGAILSAFGVSFGFDIAHYINTEANDLLSELKLYFSGDKEIGDEKLDSSLAEKEDEFLGVQRNPEKAKFFELLARVNLTIRQASFAWNNLKESSAEILNNPYLLFEMTRKENEDCRITISQIDNAMYVNKLVRNNHPIESPSRMRTEGDKRRFRAMTIYVLSRASEQGHTLLPYSSIISEIEKLPLDQRTDFQLEKIDGLIDFLQEGDLLVNEPESYIKLKEYAEYRELISRIVNSRFDTQDFTSQNWRVLIDSQFGKLQEGNEENDEKAREEKANALSIIEDSKISVLLGRAGTGKTYALGVFSSVPKIAEGGILAITPTGKARVQLEKSFKEANVDAQFMTVAQFLIKSGGYRWDTRSYKMPTKSSTSIAKTVIIDESSMLTEDMFAGILKLVDAHAERIIFVGDPNQLPPIGAGRPFVDLIYYLINNHPKNIAELTIEMRQGSGGDDLKFAQFFSNSPDIDKDIIYRISNHTNDDRLKYLQYETTDELEKLFFDELVNTTGMTDQDDLNGFNISLGATVDQYTNYLTSSKLDNWQIISPTKFVGIGSFYLNSQLHEKYRQDTVDEWKKYPWQKSPQSIQNIVYGDKVISNVNGDINYWDGSSGKEYIANGEIGIMSSFPGQYGKNDKNSNWYKFRFFSFERKVFSYTSKDFGGDNSDSKLELAYALTVHKSQGSGFGKTIVIINGKSSFITKELLYTAFSRQREQLTILSDLPISELAQYSNDWYSDTKQRYTDLFDSPNITAIEWDKQRRYYEERLIHKTSKGEMVRSKSEVIVANILYMLGIDYTYEESLDVCGRTYLPDFTLRHKGETAYLEHLGLLGDEKYNKNWECKIEEYIKVGISEAKGNLVITKDNPNGSIDAALIEEKIKTWMGK